MLSHRAVRPEPTDTHASAGSHSKYPIRLCLAIPDELLLSGLKALIQGWAPEIMQVAAVSAIEEISRTVPDCRPSVMLLDAKLIQGQGRAIMEYTLQYPILLLVDHYKGAICREALELGIRGFMLHNEAPTKLIHAIERLHCGDCWIPPPLLRGLQSPFDGLGSDSSIQRLTASELETARAMLDFAGAKNLVVAQSLNISESTLRNRLTVIYDKLGVSGKAGLVLFARENGLGRSYL